MFRFVFSVAALATLTTCSDLSHQANTGEADVTSAAISAPELPLPDYFDCVGQNNGLLVAADRGGPAPD